MKPLIDKAALMQQFVSTYDIEGGVKVPASKVYSMIINMPIEDPIYAWWLPAMDNDGWVCSNCNTDVNAWAFEKFRFCPNCGASMLGNEHMERDDHGYIRIKGC